MTKKISQLPAATSVDTNDEFVINQDGTTKKLTTANQWDFANVNIDGGSITGITDLAVADGGTGASDASGARTNLGLGTIATQNANSVDIDGGTIDGTAIGGGTASSGAFTTLSSTSTTTLNGTTIPASKTLVDTDSTQTISGKAVIGATSANVGFSSLSRFAVGGAAPAMYFDVDYYAFRSIAAGSISDSILLFNGTYPGGTSPATNSPAIRFESFTGTSFRRARLYERDGEIYARDFSNNETIISPHNFELMPEKPSEDIAWSYYSTSPNGRRVNVDMLKLVRLVEDLTGETLVYTDTVEIEKIEERTPDAK